ncbi:OmpA family protein [Nitrosophilus kaiyonis]|uniref:OmpA family protein n=1 Tax=Nitrosophilus kaiyonis TaxID=2930200 RepID=UPI00249019E7|nr:OmpA family protein [Nitrosophilus kaiyonis]
MKKIIYWISIFLILPNLLLSQELITSSKKYKFESGDKIIFFTDFKKCPVGETPEEFDDIKGMIECVRYKDHIWIGGSNSNSFSLTKKIDIGKDDFSIEFTLLPYKYRDVEIGFELFTEDPLKPGVKAFKTLKLDADPMNCNIKLIGLGVIKESLRKCPKKAFNFAIQARRSQLRIFLNGKRIGFAPLKLDKPIIAIKWYRWGLAPKPFDILLSNIKVAKYTKKEKKPTPEKLGIEVKKIKEGLKLTIPEKVLFDFNKFILKSKAKEALDIIGDIIHQNSVKQIVVTGYTDNIGSDQYNLKLSLQRAQSVADYLIYCKNIDPNLFKIIGKGKNNPIASNDTPEGRAKNRRVEIKLIK